MRKEIGLDRKRARTIELNENRRPEQQGSDDDSDGDQRREARAQAHALLSGASLLMRSKIGMYIAMTMPPTMPPRSAIISGSMQRQQAGHRHIDFFS
jgi:hypothetical protein